jgi:hypothetical protein
MNIIKWKLNFVLCNFGLKSTCDFVITRLISVQIALHSVQLPLFIPDIILRDIILRDIILRAGTSLYASSGFGPLGPKPCGGNNGPIPN